MTNADDFDRVTKLAEELFGVARADILGKRRFGKFADARHAVCWVLRQPRDPMVLEAIGKRLGNRDHKTIHHAVERIAVEVRLCTELGAAALELQRRAFAGRRAA